MAVFDTLWHRWLRRPYVLRNVRDIGKGRPVVLLHGIASDSSAWLPLVRHLDLKHFRVISFDLLGFGGSPKPAWNDYAVSDHARAVIATLRKAGVRSKVTLIGHSMGCLVAVHVARLAPDLVERLVLYEPPLFADSPEYRSHAKRRQRYFAFYEYISNHPELLMLQHRRLYRLAQRLSGFTLDETTWLPFERSLKHTIMRQTAYDELAASSVPTDIIHGRLDFVVVRADVKRMFAGNPHIRLHTVTEFHDITPTAGKYLAGLLDGVQPQPRRRRRRSRRRRT